MATWFDQSLVNGQTLIARFNDIATALGLLAPKANPTFTGTVTGTFSGNLTGNASSATALQTARTINGTSFNGTANITVSASTTATLTRGTYLTGTDFNGSVASTWAVDATSTSTASKVVVRDGSGNFAAGTITAALSGNASSATTLSAGADRTKLDGIAAGATVNSTDAALRARSSHTGTQAISTIVDLQTELDAKAPTAAPTFSGTATFTTVASGLVRATTALDLGATAGVANTPYIDFNSGATAVDYDCRIMASGGTGAVGQGKLTYYGLNHEFLGKVSVTLINAASDAAASAAGVPIGALYRNGSVVMIRVV